MDYSAMRLEDIETYRSNTPWLSWLNWLNWLEPGRLLFIGEGDKNHVVNRDSLFAHGVCFLFLSLSDPTGLCLLNISMLKAVWL